MSIVVDCSVLASAWLEDEADPFSKALVLSATAGDLHAPALLPFELSNILLMAERRRRIHPDDRLRALEEFSSLPLTIDGNAPFAIMISASKIAHEHGLTVYDAVYLELAIRFGYGLATYDTALAKAARKAGVRVLPE